MTLTALDRPLAKNEINILLLSASRKALARPMIPQFKTFSSCFPDYYARYLRSRMLYKVSHHRDGELNLSTRS